MAPDGYGSFCAAMALCWGESGRQGSGQLRAPPKNPKKRYRSHSRQPFVATAPNQVWAYDFVFDGCANVDKLKRPTMVDEFTKESLCIDVAGSIRSKRLIQVPKQLIKERGCPMVLRSDDAPVFVSVALVQWTAEHMPRSSSKHNASPTMLSGTTPAWNTKHPWSSCRNGNLNQQPGLRLLDEIFSKKPDKSRKKLF